MSVIRIGFSVEAKREPLLRLLSALVSLDQAEIRTRRLPRLYAAGVRYQREQRRLGQPEDWKTFTALLRDGFGDCEDLASARVAELREIDKIRAIPWLLKKPGSRTWHVVVRYPDGTIEDPSKALGMGKKET